MSDKKTGLFFGSFNPIHNGHLMIASYMLNFTNLDDIWFVISPQSPFKDKNSLLPNHHRLAMVEAAIGKHDKMRACDIEFKMPTPSYTIDTLVLLNEKYPKRSFALIMGADNLATLNKWKNYEEILNNYNIYIYPRPGNNPGILKNHPSVISTSAPVIEISSSFIRQSVKNGKDMSFFLPEEVYRYILEMHFYEK